MLNRVVVYVRVCQLVVLSLNIKCISLISVVICKVIMRHLKTPPTVTFDDTHTQ